MTSDEQLMLNVAGGDMAAFSELVERHHRNALNIAYRFLTDPVAAEDIVHEAFLKILASAERYRPSARFRTYLFNVIWHLCIDTYRRKRPQPLDSGPVAEARSDGPDQLVLRQERQELVREAVGELPPRQRMALVLKHYEGLSYEEIAEAMKCSTRAVDSLLIRARRTLKERLDGLL